MIKLIVSDLDGTLLDEPNSISEINLKAIEYAHEHGAEFCFATGRDMASIESIKALLKHEPYLLLGNGALFYDNEGKLLGEEYFPNKYLKEVTDILNSHNVRHMIFTTDGFYTTTDIKGVRDKFLERISSLTSAANAKIFRESDTKPCNNLALIEDMDEFVRTKKIIKVEGFDMDYEPIEAAKKDLEKYTELSHMSTGKNNVEVTAYRAQKGVVLKNHLKDLGLNEEEVMVLGDSSNDMSLFDEFKYSFAPANSRDDIKEKAYKIVASCMDHGVAEAIYEMIK